MSRRRDAVEGWWSVLSPAIVCLIGVWLLFTDDYPAGVAVIALGTLGVIADELKLIRRRLTSDPEPPRVYLLPGRAEGTPSDQTRGAS